MTDTFFKVFLFIDKFTHNKVTQCIFISLEHKNFKSVNVLFLFVSSLICIQNDCLLLLKELGEK